MLINTLCNRCNRCNTLPKTLHWENLCAGLNPYR